MNSSQKSKLTLPPKIWEILNADGFNKKRNSIKLSDYDCTDAGNAELFSTLFDGYLVFDYDSHNWFVWDGVNWKCWPKAKIRLFATETARIRLDLTEKMPFDGSKENSCKWSKRSQSLKYLDNTLEMAVSSPNIFRKSADFDNNPFLLGCENGTYDLSSDNFIAPQKKHMLTKSTNFSYDSNAKYPRWRQFIEEIFQNDNELALYIQKVIGYTLTGDTGEQVFFILYGNGSNGKSLFLNIISRLLGDYAGSLPFSALELKYGNAIPNDLATLKGKRFVIFSESSENSKFDTAKLKVLTGNDKIAARYLHREFFEFYLQCKIFFHTNNLPSVRDKSHGFWRRTKVIKFTNKFSEDKIDKYLEAKLISELPGILNWAIEGYRLYKVEGLQDPESVKQATASYMAESDFFESVINRNFICNSDAQCSAKEILDIVNRSFLEMGLSEISSKKLKQLMVELGFQSKNATDKRTSHYCGLEIKRGCDCS